MSLPVLSCRLYANLTMKPCLTSPPTTNNSAKYVPTSLSLSAMDNLPRSITVRASFSSKNDMFEVFVEEGVAPLLPQTPVLLQFGSFNTWTVATPTVGVQSLFKTASQSNSSHTNPKNDQGCIKLSVVRRVLLLHYSSALFNAPSYAHSPILSTPMARSTFAENEALPQI